MSVNWLFTVVTNWWRIARSGINKEYLISSIKSCFSLSKHLNWNYWSFLLRERPEKEVVVKTLPRAWERGPQGIRIVLRWQTVACLLLLITHKHSTVALARLVINHRSYRQPCLSNVLLKLEKQIYTIYMKTSENKCETCNFAFMESLFLFTYRPKHV